MNEDDDLQRPQEEFIRFLGTHACDGTEHRLIESWLRSWDDRKGAWANLRNFQHWIERARD